MAARCTGQGSTRAIAMAVVGLFAIGAPASCTTTPDPGGTPQGTGGSPPAGKPDAQGVVDVAPTPDANSGTGGSPAGTGGTVGTGGSNAGTGGSPAGTGGSDGGTADLGADGPGEVNAPTGVVKMMVMGSSNETGTCWRAFLWQKLRAAGVTNFDFVGGQMDGPACGVPGYDRDDESRNGTIVSQLSAAEFNRRFKANPPDIVLVHFGGADVLQNIATARVVEGYTRMVEQGRAVNPRIRFLVAEHTPMTPSSCPRCPMTVPELNAATVAWAKTMDTPASPVGTVDLFTGLDPATDTSDRVHLNNAGSQKVADIWVKALLPIFKP